MYTNGYSFYATGWYSSSPALPGGTLMLIVWLRSKHAEKQRVVEEDKQQKKVNSEKIAEGTISIYA